MIRVRTLTSLAALTAVLSFLALVPARAGAKAEHRHEMFEKCAKACFDCSRECASCFHHCAHLVADGKKEHAKTMHLCNDCGTICAAAGELAGRAGPLSATLCDACAKACDICGEACEKFPDDKHMTACAKACRDCAKACREMVKHAGH